MLKKLQTYLLFGNTFCGIEHNNKQTVEAVLLQKKSNEIIIKDSFVTTTVEEIAEKLPKKQHVFLVLNNDDVLSKFVQSTEKESNRLLFEAFPNLKINDFYYEIDSQGSFHNIAICRKSIVDKLIASYKIQQITIIGFSLGNTMTSFVNDFIEESNYYTSNALLTQENEAITEIQLIENPPNKTHTINGLEVKSSQLLSFSGVLSHILQSKTTVSNFEEKETELVTNFKQQRFFSQFSMFGLGFVLFLLLINFFVFNSYYSTVEEMKQTAAVNSNQKEKLLTLKTLVEQKQKTVDDILKKSSSKSSYYIDAIATSLPNTLQLSALKYQPLTKRIKKNNPIQLKKEELIISGISTDSDLFSDWIQKIESLDWVVAVTVADYGAVSKNNSEFTLKIELSDE
ncbi:hypothetical protein U8527_11240 [Kordia algicida OT-1]|uniref:hypothetical protein n=1 Tax=Kordia algicida TaxID=221066 RepID=UPI003D9B9E33